MLGQPAAQRGVGEQPFDGVGQLGVGEGVGVQPHPEPEFVDALGVFVLVPEQRQHDQRLAEVQRLGDGVVAAVGDHQVDLRDHLGLRQHLRADHVVRQRDPVGLRSLADDEAVPGGAEHVDQALHEFDVGAAERAQRQVDERAVVGPVGDLGGHHVFVVGLAHAGVHPGPAVVERPGVEVVGLGGVDVQVGGVVARA